MRYRTLGESGHEVPVLSLGCGNFGGIGSSSTMVGRGEDRDAAFALMDAALQAGLRMFDTANSYAGGISEDWIGQWLHSRGTRGEVALTTKVGNPVGPRPEDRGLSRSHIREQADRSLRRLRTDRIDLYLAHAPDDSAPIEEPVSAFDELIQDGKVAHYGLSNFDADRLTNAVTAADALGVRRPANLQNEYNLFERAEPALDVCARTGIGFTAYSPLAGGLLTGKYRANQPPPTGSRLDVFPAAYAHLHLDKAFTALTGLAAAADRRGVPLPALALALAWLLADPRLASAVVGPRSPAHLTTMCAALDIELTHAERIALAPDPH